MPEYIEREAFREYWNKEFRHLYPNDKYLVALANFPAADVAEVRHGYWKEADNTRRGHKFICSECNGVSYYPQPTRDKNWVKHCGYAHCPYCLAKMDGKGESK